MDGILAPSYRLSACQKCEQVNKSIDAGRVSITDGRHLDYLSLNEFDAGHSPSECQRPPWIDGALRAVSDQSSHPSKNVGTAIRSNMAGYTIDYSSHW